MNIKISTVWFLCACWIIPHVAKWAMGLEVTNLAIAGDICIVIFCIALTVLAAIRGWIFGERAA